MDNESLFIFRFTTCIKKSISTNLFSIFGLMHQMFGLINPLVQEFCMFGLTKKCIEEIQLSIQNKFFSFWGR